MSLIERKVISPIFRARHPRMFGIQAKDVSIKGTVLANPKVNSIPTTFYFVSDWTVFRVCPTNAVLVVPLTLFVWCSMLRIFLP
jgi:hypothetical protein